jgi:hypothetical protein
MTNKLCIKTNKIVFLYSADGSEDAKTVRPATRVKEHVVAFWADVR